METKTHKVVAAVIEKDGKVLVARRKAGMTAGGLWEFPGGKLEEGEAAPKCLERELEEELGIRSRAGSLLCTVPFSGPIMTMELLVFRTELLSSDFRLTDHDEIRWLEPAKMDESLFSEPDRPVVRMLAGRDKPGKRQAGRPG